MLGKTGSGSDRRSGRLLAAWGAVLMFALVWAAAGAPVLADEPVPEASETEGLQFDDTPRRIGLGTPDWFRPSFLDIEEDLELARERGRMGLAVYFGMDDCPYCEALFEQNFSQDDIRSYLSEHFDVIAIDVLGSREVTTLEGETLEEKEWARSMGLNFTPSLAFFDADGEGIHAMRGYYPPYRFRALLEYVIDRHDREESFREYLDRAEPPPKFDLEDINERDFFDPPPHELDRTREAGERPLVVFFEREACHACDILHSEPLQNQQVLEQISLMDAVQLDMGDDATPVVTPDGRETTAARWSRDLDIHWAPSMVFFDEQGDEIIRLDSVAHLNRVRNVMEYVLTRGYEDFDTFERWRARR